MADALDFNKLRRLSSRDIAQYLRQAPPQSANAITERLLQAVEQGSIPAATFTIWLGVAPKGLALKPALAQNISIGVRRAAIKRLKTDLRSESWREVWKELGAIQGVLDLMRTFSVLEVRDLCLVLGSVLKGNDLQEKRDVVTELFKALFPRTYPQAAYHLQDDRPLERYYQYLVPSCTSEIIEAIVEGKLSGDWTRVRIKFLLISNAPAMRNIALRLIFDDRAKYPDWLPALFQQPNEDSAQFKIDILRRLVKSPKSAIPDHDFVQIFAGPLIRQIVRSEFELRKQIEVLSMLLSYLGNRPDAAKDMTTLVLKPLLHQKIAEPAVWSHRAEILQIYLSSDLKKFEGHRADCRKLLPRVAQYWSIHAGNFQDYLVSLLQYGYQTKDRSLLFGSYEQLLQTVDSSQRYALLRIANKAVIGLDIDIDKDLKQTEGSISYSLLEQLDGGHALDLLKRLRTLRGDANILNGGSAVTNLSTTPNGIYGDPNLIWTLLLRRHGQYNEAEGLAQTQISARKKKATTSPEQSQRAWYAKSVLYYAFASGSLRLTKEVFLWARRFIRDALTVLQLFQYYPPEALGLFHRSAKQLEAHFDVRVLSERIASEHELLEILFDTVYVALKEPSFQSSHWKGAFDLLKRVVDLRIKDSPQLLETGKINDDQLYDTVWKSTIEFIVKTEEKALKPGHERLGMTGLSGILGSSPNPIRSETRHAPLSTYRFLDGLAEARDHLWQQYRATVHPATVELAAAYPRGLPVQHLIWPLVLSESDLEKVTPYIARRVKSAVFPTLEQASTPFPSDEDKQAAIGHFVDDYHYALRLYIPKTISKEEQLQRCGQACSHVVKILSQTRMTTKEAISYWEPVINKWNKEYLQPIMPKNKPKSTDWALIPEVDDATQPEEWSPTPPKGPDVKARLLGEPTYIDLSKTMNTVYASTIGSRLYPSEPRIPSISLRESDIWAWEQLNNAREAPAMREAQIASALLFLDTTNATNNRVLAKPFPTSTDARYPSLFLDNAFLSEQNSKWSAIYALERHIRFVPPLLLSQLVQNTVQSLITLERGQSHEADVERNTFQLVKTLARSDRPGLAIELAVNLVFQRPDASSWHRQILIPTIFKRLAAADAENCFTLFANTIIDKLDEQAREREASQLLQRLEATKLDASLQRNPTATEIGPTVKVTTVKYLAQLLRDTDFIPPRLTLTILSIIIEKASHPDIKGAALDSLLELLRSSTPELTESVFTTLEAILPMTGKLNERQPITQANWAAAWDAPERPAPPEVDFSDETTVPILITLRKFLQTVDDKFRYRTAYVNRIILPTLSSLQRETKKWLEIFLPSILASSSILEEVPIVPRNIWEVQGMLRRHSRDLPLSILHTFTDYLMICLKPSPAISNINATLKADPELRSRPAVTQWLKMFDPSIVSTVAQATVTFQDLLSESTQTNRTEDGITLKEVQTAFLKVFTATLWTDNAQYLHLQGFFNLVAPSPLTKSWQEPRRPLLEAMILYIESLRTRDWERDPKRQPSVLPETFPLRLWLLSYPNTDTATSSAPPDAAANHKEETREAQCKVYAEQVSKLVFQITGSLYHKKLLCIKDSFRFVNGSAERVLVALYLGDLGTKKLSWASMGDVVRVELAVELLRQGVNYGGEALGPEIKGRLDKMLVGWEESDSEEIRRLVVELKAAKKVERHWKG